MSLSSGTGGNVTTSTGNSNVTVIVTSTGGAATSTGGAADSTGAVNANNDNDANTVTNTDTNTNTARSMRANFDEIYDSWFNFQLFRFIFLNNPSLF